MGDWNRQEVQEVQCFDLQYIRIHMHLPLSHSLSHTHTHTHTHARTHDTEHRNARPSHIVVGLAGLLLKSSFSTTTAMKVGL